MIGFEQKLVGMLTVDLDKQLAQIAQLRKGHRRAIDKATGTTISTDHPAQQALIAVVELIFHQPALSRRGGLKLEAGAKVGPAGTLTHHVSIGTAAQT